jgi:mannose-1-phosphate guanylyltransferase/mannose-6-phosphate isomerase
LKNKSIKITPIILSGGSGRRLWPMSTSDKPKQFIENFFYKNSSLFKESLTRIQFLKKNTDYVFNKTIIVGSLDSRFEIRNIVENFDDDFDVLIEPVQKNTAPAIALAAHRDNKNSNDESILFVFPSDHAISTDKELLKSFNSAYAKAIKSDVVILGIRPKNKDANYGYIKTKKSIVESFVEKPTTSRINNFLKNNNYFWNSGIYVFRRSALISALDFFDKKTLNLTKKISSAEVNDGLFFKYPTNLYKLYKNISIDYSLTEKLAQNKNFELSMVELKSHWSDLGTWNSIKKYFSKSRGSASNLFHGNVSAKDTIDTTIISSRMNIFSLGLENTTMIEHNNSILAFNNNKIDDLKGFINSNLKKKLSKYLDESTVVQRPWGYYEIIISTQFYKVKKLVLYPTRFISLQKHNHRIENWTIVSGEAKVIKAKNIFKLNVGESISIPKKTKHQLINLSKKNNLVVIEVQTGEYFGEDDIVRY